MSPAGWTISVIAVGIVFAIVFWSMRARHPEQTAAHQHDDGEPPRLAGGMDRPAGPDAEPMTADLRPADRQDRTARAGAAEPEDRGSSRGDGGQHR